MQDQAVQQLVSQQEQQQHVQPDNIMLAKEVAQHVYPDNIAQEEYSVQEIAAEMAYIHAQPMQHVLHHHSLVIVAM